MGCISDICPKRLSCKLWASLDASNDVDWSRYASGGSDTAMKYYCGPMGEYKMYEPIEEIVIGHSTSVAEGSIYNEVTDTIITAPANREIPCAICGESIILTVTERDKFVCDKCRDTLKALIDERNSNKNDNLPTSEEYRNSRLITLQTKTEPKPSYKCPKCGGGMCKDFSVVLTSYPAQYYYICNECGYKESNY